MSEPCFGSLQAVRLRVAKLNAAGAPLTGAGNAYVTKGLIQVQVNLEIEQGVKLTLKNGGDEVCQTYRGCDRILSATLGLELCQLEYELIAMLGGLPAIREIGGAQLAIGFKYPGSEDACPNGVSFEIWTKAWDNSRQATPAFMANALAYHHWVFTRSTWLPGQATVQDDFLHFPMSGTGVENDGLTINGPFNDWPAEVVAAGGFDTVGGVFLDSVIPAASCAAVAVTSAAS